MPIVINEFEILPEAPPPAAGSGGERPPSTPPPVGPEEIVRAIARHHERLARVTAD